MITIGLIATTSFEKQSISHNLSLLKYLNKCYKSFRILNFYCIFESEWWSYKNKIRKIFKVFITFIFNIFVKIIY